MGKEKKKDEDKDKDKEKNKGDPPKVESKEDVQQLTRKKKAGTVSARSKGKLIVEGDKKAASLSKRAKKEKASVKDLFTEPREGDSTETPQVSPDESDKFKKKKKKSKEKDKGKPLNISSVPIDVKCKAVLCSLQTFFLVFTLCVVWECFLLNERQEKACSDCFSD